MAEESEKTLKVRSIYHTKYADVASETDDQGTKLAYGENVLLSCLEALKTDKPVLDRLKPALYLMRNYEADNVKGSCLAANLSFFEIMGKRKKTLKSRSKTIPIRLGRGATYQEAYHHKSFLHEKSLEGDDEKWADQVPRIFDGFGITEDHDFSAELSQVLKLWTDCLIERDIETEFVQSSLAFLTLRTLVICGEYLHLHKLKNAEARVWNLAYTLAAAQQQLKTCIYITSRCLKSKFISKYWIEMSKNCIENNKELQDTEVVAIFWLELASFYFDCGKIEEAKILLERVKKSRCYDYPNRTNDPVVFGYAADVEFRNYFLHDETSQEGYVNLMVKMHYALRDFHDSLGDKERYDEIEYKLLGFSKMFDILCDVIMPTVSLHWHFEIYSHINDWFLVAQHQGWTLRIVDCLKYLCYIDLLLHRVELCEEKLNELEKILCLAKFQELPLVEEKSKKKKYVYRCPATNQVIEKPSLTKKLFRIPVCFTPKSTPCHCLTCTSIDYVYTLFACTYIRAQVYCFVDYEAESGQYFYAAAKLQKAFGEVDSTERRSRDGFAWRKDRSCVVDYLMFLADFGLFLKKFTPEKGDDAFLLFEEAIAVAKENGLSKHPATVFATEMMFEHQLYSLDQEKLFSAIYVPPIEYQESESEEDTVENVVEKKRPMTRSQSAKLALEQKMQQGPMTRSKAAELLKAQASSSKK